jgi:hypothetical protein
MDNMELLDAMREMMAKAEADRKADNQAKAEANTKADHERMERQISFLASKMDINQAQMEERPKEAVNAIRSELDEGIEKTPVELQAEEVSL